MNVMLKEFIRKKTKKDEKKKGRPVGCFISRKIKKGDEEYIIISMSRYNTKKEDKPFSKKLAYEIAYNRNIKIEKDFLNNDYKNYDLNLKINGLANFISRSKKYFKCDKIII